MQTFVTEDIGQLRHRNPLLVCMRTAASLDSPRLGKQRVEAKQIHAALTSGQGWVHHPATRMWQGYDVALAVYGWYMCLEWQRRGYEDTLGDWFADNATLNQDPQGVFPWWFGHEYMVQSHRSKLINKLESHYAPAWAGSLEAPNMCARHELPYLWPTGKGGSITRNGTLVPQGFYLSVAEFKRGDFTVPHWWQIDSKTRRVTFDE